MRVYLDNAASTPLDPEVLEHMIPLFRDLNGNPSSVHSHGRQLRAVIEKARKTVAQNLGAAPAEIFFTSGGTEADNMAIRCSVEGLGIRHIVSSKIEHHAVTHPIEKLEAEGKVSVTWLDLDEKGNPDLDQLDKVLQDKPESLVSLMHANNEIGTMLDLVKIGQICRKHGALFHSDTVQSMTQYRFNLSEMPVDFVTASAHKFYGPKGVGFLYVRSGVKIPALVLGGSQERNMRAGTENVPAISGLAFALDKAYKHFDEKAKHLLSLKSYMKSRLQKEFGGLTFNGETEPGRSLPTVLNVSFPGDGNESMLLFNLDIAGISASGGSACTSGSVTGSHVLLGIGVDPIRAANSVRFSFGTDNTIEELDYCMEQLMAILAVKA